MNKPKIDRTDIWYRPEPCQDTVESITALNAEARERDVSYGQLVSLTTEIERFEIVEAYQRRKKKHGKKAETWKLD